MCSLSGAEKEQQIAYNSVPFLSFRMIAVTWQSAPVTVQIQCFCVLQMTQDALIYARTCPCICPLTCPAL